MNKYVSCFLFFLCLTGGCLVTLFFLAAQMEEPEVIEVQMKESIEEPAFALNMDDVEEAGVSETIAHIVLNQTEPSRETEAQTQTGQYYLVAEEGYLIVYDNNSQSVNLFTYLPLSDFPVDEQEKLMDGLWFETMTDVFSYLESYTS